MRSFPKHHNRGVGWSLKEFNSPGAQLTKRETNVVEILILGFLCSDSFV